jgi:HlyD family secretion protein
MNRLWSESKTSEDLGIMDEHAPREKGIVFSLKKRALAIIVLVLLVAIGTGAYVYSTTMKNGTTKYRLAKVERGSLIASVSASGTLNAVTTVQVGSQISGMVKQIFVDFNSPVKKNQLIARIDPETLEAKVNQARADLESAQANVFNQTAAVERARAEVDNARAAIAGAKANTAKAKVAVADAKLTLDRRVDLLKRELISQSEKDTAQYAYDSAVATLEASEAQEHASQSTVRSAQAQLRVTEAQVQAAEAQVRQKRAALAQAQVDLDHTFIRAPVDGVVVSRNVDAGQTVAASLQAPVLFTIAQDLTRMQVDANIDEADIGRTREGMEAMFTVDSFPGETFRGRVVQIRKAPQVVQNVVTYIVVIAVSNPAQKLMPGMTANVKLVVDRKENTLKIPNAALRFRPPGEGGARSGAQSARPADQSAGRGDGARRGGGGGSGSQEEFRQRLVTELGLTAEQQAKLEAIQAETRKAIAALRDQASDEKARQAERQKILSEASEKTERILNAEQRKKYEELVAQERGQDGAPGRVFIPGPDGKPKAVAVVLGVSDGNSTEILRGDVREGQEVIVGLSERGQPNAPSQPRLRL